MPFVKLDCSILYSSIWSESSDTCKVWITMLALADQTGLVPATAPGISSASFISIEKTRAAISVLETPDPDSKSMEHEGRRIKRVEGGYLILNYEKYRSFNYSMRKEAVRKREYRTKTKEVVRDIKRDIVPKCPGHSASVYASEVLSYLNSKTGKKYRNTQYIEARLKEGFTVEQLKGIVDVKFCDRHFIDHPHLMNPVTLFRPSHIDNYLNQTPQDFHKPSTHERIRPNTQEAPTRELTPEEERDEKIKDLGDSIRNAKIFLSRPEAQKDKNAMGIVQRNLDRCSKELAEMQGEK